MLFASFQSQSDRVVAGMMRVTTQQDTYVLRGGDAILPVLVLRPCRRPPGAVVALAGQVEAILSSGLLVHRVVEVHAVH